MNQPPPPDDEAEPPADGEELEEYVALGAVLPIIAPDETSGIETVRDMDDEEVAQFQHDAELLRALAPAAPYSRAADAFHAAEDVVREVGDTEPRPLSRRGQQRVLRALAAFSRAMEALPNDLTTTLVERLGQGDAARRLAAARAELEDHPAFGLATALDTAPANHFVAVVQGDVVELLLPREALARWPAATVLVNPGDVPLLDTAANALAFSQRMASRWLLEHADEVHEASRRIARLGGEVAFGRAGVITITLRRREGEEPAPVHLKPVELPLEEMQAVQATLRRAERLLADEPREPALKGGQGLYAEQVAAAMAENAFEGEHERSDVGESGGGEEPEREDSPIDRADRPLDMGSLIAHLQLGAVRMERAWSRALEDDGVAELAAEWASLVTGAVASFKHADRGLPDGQRLVELPVSAEFAASVSLELGSPNATTQARLAQAARVATIVETLPALRTPMQRSTDRGSGRSLEWFSSGAFAALRDQLGFLARVSGLGPDAPDWVHSLSLAVRAARRADPEAVVMHVARAVQAHGPGALTEAGEAVAEVLDRTADAARRLAAGDQLDLAAVALLADAALRAAAEVLDAELPGPG